MNGPDSQNKRRTAKVLLKDFHPQGRHRGKLIFVDEKLRVFPAGRWSRIHRSPRRGFVGQVAKNGRFEPLNIYRDPRGQVSSRTLSQWLKEDWEIEKEIKKRCREAKNAKAIEPTAIVRTVTNGLPEKILILDIETSGKLDEPPNAERILLVGIKEFNLGVGGYQPSGYEHYEGKPDWEPLRLRLRQPSDFILGHNLFGFDYYFLESIVDIRSIAAKTVDLFLWLCSCVGCHRRLGLDDLCRLNLGCWKTRFGKSMKQLSRLPDKSSLYYYNERDLDLTFRLWLQAVERKKIQTRAAGLLTVTDQDLDYLMARKSILTYRAWTNKRRAWDSKVPSPLHREAVLQRLGNHDTELVIWPSYSVIVCANCFHTTAYCLSEEFRRVLENGADVPAHYAEKRGLKSFRLKCAHCEETIKTRSLSQPIQIGNFAIRRLRIGARRTPDDWSMFGCNGSGHVLARFGRTLAELL